MQPPGHSVESMTPAIELLGVTKRYVDGTRRVTAADAVSLSIAPKSLSIVRGPSGSGKTTLLGLMGGIVAPTSGEVRVAGESLTKMRDHHRARWRRDHVGFVFQELGLISGMSVLENVTVPFVPLGGATEAALVQARTLLAKLGVDPLEHMIVDRLSGGERQRVALARALVAGASVLLLDEPTAQLDSARAGEVLDLLVSLRDEGRTVVVSTHDPRIYGDPRADVVLTLLDGRVTPAPDDAVAATPRSGKL